MSTHSKPVYMLASHDPALLASFEPVLVASGAAVQIVLSAEAALAAMAAPQPPALALLDANLPGMESRVTVDRLLAAARADADIHPFPIVLISDTVSPQWLERLNEELIDDLIPRTAGFDMVPVRIGAALRHHRRVRELGQLREAAVLNVQMDRLTGVYNRESMLAVLFRETDRVQRMKTSLSLILFDIDDFAHWNSRLGADACDDLLCQVAGRAARVLRSYDLIGRAGNDEFLIALPGAAGVHAAMLAERLRLEVFCLPFHVIGESIRLSACFGIASSQGRSPVVVLREAEQALHTAQATGPESIQCFGESPQPEATPVTFFSLDSGNELLAW